MFVKKEVIAQVVKLFTEEPKCRDMKFGTIERVVELHYKEEFGANVEATAKLVMEIDRAYRFIQQHVPALRGRKWLKRQNQGGVITAEEYKSQMASINAIKKICIQLELAWI
jgi:hypothetical protein